MSTGLYAKLHYCSNIQLTTVLLLTVSFYCSEVGLTPSLFCFGSRKCTLMPHCHPYKTLDIHRYAKKHEDSGKQPGFCLDHSSRVLSRIPLEQRILEGFSVYLKNLFCSIYINKHIKYKQSVTITRIFNRNSTDSKKMLNVAWPTLMGDSLPKEIDDKLNEKWQSNTSTLSYFPS